MRLARSVRISILVLTALALPAARAAAQSQQSYDSPDTYGVKAGVLWSTLDLVIPDAIISENQQLGFTAGFFGSTRLAGPLYLDFEVLVTTKGTKYDFADFENELRLTYLELPVLARVGVLRAGAVTAYVSGGPSFAFKLKEVQKEAGEETSVDDEVKKWDIGIAMGGGVSFGSWVVDARYTLGLIDIVDIDSAGFAEPTAKNRAISVTFGYRF
jgi:opacity protein-like surface antigen